MRNNTHLNEHLAKCFISYFCSLKEDANALNFTEIYTAFFYALGGLDKEHNCADFVNKTKEGFELIAKHLDKIAQGMYKDERVNLGLVDRRPSVESLLSVKDAARKLGISEQAVRKHIQNKKLVAQMNSRHNYTITPMALREFMSNRKKSD